MEPANIKLDKYHYQGIILGTGMHESLLSAALAYKAYASINFDKDSSYSAAIKTCSIKEFNSLFSSFFPAQKNHIFKILDYTTTISEEEKGKLRGFNIDLQPRFLYSTSLTVSKMVEAGMDKYMDFRAISGVFFFDEDSSKFVKMPISKGEIFASGSLSLLEKRKLFKFLHTCTSISKVLANSEGDLNSTAEFDKDLKLEEDLVKEVIAIKDAHFIKFLDLMGISGKLANLLLYVIANYLYSIEDSKNTDCFLTTQGFIDQVEKFIKSMGVHSIYPYLYTNYGTSDIPQGFSRASAVNGSIFILNPQLDLQNLTQTQGEDSDGNKFDFKLKTSMAGEKEFLTSEVLVINKDYVNLLEGFQETDLSFESKSLLRITMIVEDVQKNITVDTPSFYYIFPQNKDIGNSSPVFIFATGEKTNSAPNNFYIFYIQTVINSNEDEAKVKELETSLRNFVGKSLCSGSEYRELLHASYIQVRRRYAKENDVVSQGRAVILDDDDFGLDFDEYFKKSSEYMKKLTPESPELLFYQNAQKDGDNNQANVNEEEDVEEDAHLKNLLASLDTFKIENQTPETKEGQETKESQETKEGQE